MSRRLRDLCLVVLVFTAGLVGTALADTPAAPSAPGSDAFLIGVDPKGLDADEKGDLVSLMKEGVCPCDPKSSMYDCIQAKKCDKALELAKFGADKYREGLGEDQVRQAVVQKYFDDNVTFDFFDLKDAPRKGAAKGRVTMVEFADFECPHCALLAKLMPEVLKAYPNDVTLYFKNYPLPFHQFAEPAARACFAAGKQGKYWQMNELVFSNQTTLAAEKFGEYANELGLNASKFKADMESAEAHAYVDRDKAEGQKAQINGTPTLYINGKLYYGEKTVEAIKAQLDKVLKAKPAAATPKGK